MDRTNGHRRPRRRDGWDDDDEGDEHSPKHEDAGTVVFTYGARRTVGRPMGLSPELIDMAYAMLLTGADQAEVAKALNIGESTFYYWMTQGRKQQEARAAGEPIDNDLYLQFLEAVEQAKAMFVVRGLAAINAAAVRSPNTILELLGRRYPARYGPTVKRAMSADDLMEALDTLPDDEFNRLFANYAARGLSITEVTESTAVQDSADGPTAR